MNDLQKDHHFALDLKITADAALRAWTGEDQREGTQQAAEAMLRELFYKGTKWLERYEKTTETISLFAPPPLLDAFMDGLERQGKRFKFDERGWVKGGGGWKTSKKERISQADYMKRIEDVLGIPATHFEDGYSQSELNITWLTCPEGHYYHAACTHLKPLVLDSNLEPVGYDEWGRLACLDALAHSYPGFIMSGDKVRLLEHCPVCDRPGPVLDQTIDRLPSEEMRGCATMLMGVFKESLERVERG